MEKYTMIALSTAHITKETAKLMELDEIEGVILYQKDNVGWFVHIPEECDFDELKDQGCTYDLYQCMKYALDNGCDWIMFDCDVDVNEAPGLHVYEW